MKDYFKGGKWSNEDFLWEVLFFFFLRVKMLGTLLDEVEDSADQGRRSLPLRMLAKLFERCCLLMLGNVDEALEELELKSVELESESMEGQVMYRSMIPKAYFGDLESME